MSSIEQSTHRGFRPRAGSRPGVQGGQSCGMSHSEGREGQGDGLGDDRGTRPTVRVSAYDDAYLDGLFTYCLSVMCEHDAATAALGEALALAERRYERGRRPTEPGLWRPWLYALARWACLRRLTAQRESREQSGVPRASGPDADLRRRELAALAWPEAAGTNPEQREALELAVRHQLPLREIAEVLRVSQDAARVRLTRGACEVERTRVALAVVRSGGCAVVAPLSGKDRQLLGPGLRRELVRHVEDCAACGRSAQRAMTGAGWSGAGTAESARLTVLPAPRQAVQAARRAALRARARHAPRFDRAGFPLPTGDRAARRERLRSRAITTTAVATVLAAPILAFWTAYRGAPVIGEPERSADVSASEDDAAYGYGPDDHTYENAGRADRTENPRGGVADDRRPASRAPDAAEDQLGGGEGDTRAETPRSDGSSPPPEDAAPGRLTVDATPTGAGTRITLTASGGAPVHWSAAADANWLRLSHSSGVLRPGETATIMVSVDRDREPSDPWRAQITIDPAGSTVTVEGEGSGETEPSEPSEPPPPTEDPDSSAPPPPPEDAEPSREAG